MLHRGEKTSEAMNFMNFIYWFVIGREVKVVLSTNYEAVNKVDKADKVHMTK
jgi:hypothetical protein